MSLRSTGRVAIDQVCSRLGGGGHIHAAGVLLRGNRAEARGRILPELHRLIEALPADPETAERILELEGHVRPRGPRQQNERQNRHDESHATHGFPSLSPLYDGGMTAIRP